VHPPEVHFYYIFKKNIPSILVVYVVVHPPGDGAPPAENSTGPVLVKSLIFMTLEQYKITTMTVSVCVIQNSS